ncbi:MAG: 50S ribosomal protein L35 [Candidatus Kerfeldbacteria bacterium]|nr:50S ribosomal protein L35 [Candidatus Kerfeldbacteria bacterium]
MPKLKTHKATRKRIKISKRAKVLVRQAGQDHFNSRDPGKVTVRKRRDRTLSSRNNRAIHSMVPYLQKR